MAAQWPRNKENAFQKSCNLFTRLVLNEFICLCSHEKGRNLQKWDYFHKTKYKIFNIKFYYIIYFLLHHITNEIFILTVRFMSIIL